MSVFSNGFTLSAFSSKFMLSAFKRVLNTVSLKTAVTVRLFMYALSAVSWFIYYWPLQTVLPRRHLIHFYTDNVERKVSQKAMQNFIIWKNWPVKGLCGRCLSAWGPEPHPPPPPTHTLYACIQYTYSHREGGVESWTGEKGRGATWEITDRRAGLKIPTLLNGRKKLAISSLQKPW